MFPEEPTRLEISSGAQGAVIVQMISASRRNLLTVDLLRQLALASPQHPAASRLVITGGPQFFSAGADLRAIAALTGASAWRMARQGQYWLRQIADSPIPYVAAVDGYCLGGGFDLAMACAQRLCTPRAYLGHHGARLGIVTGWGGTQTIPRRIGPAPALDHLLAANGWDAEQALRQRLVSEISPPETLIATACRLPILP